MVGTSRARMEELPMTAYEFVMFLIGAGGLGLQITNHLNKKKKQKKTHL